MSAGVVGDGPKATLGRGGPLVGPPPGSPQPTPKPALGPPVGPPPGSPRGQPLGPKPGLPSGPPLGPPPAAPTPILSKTSGLVADVVGESSKATSSTSGFHPQPMPKPALGPSAGPPPAAPKATAANSTEAHATTVLGKTPSEAAAGMAADAGATSSTGSPQPQATPQPALGPPVGPPGVPQGPPLGPPPAAPTPAEATATAAHTPAILSKTSGLPAAMVADVVGESPKATSSTGGPQPPPKPKPALGSAPTPAEPATAEHAASSLDAVGVAENSSEGLEACPAIQDPEPKSQEPGVLPASTGEDQCKGPGSDAMALAAESFAEFGTAPMVAKIRGTGAVDGGTTKGRALGARSLGAVRRLAVSRALQLLDTTDCWLLEERLAQLEALGSLCNLFGPLPSDIQLPVFEEAKERIRAVGPVSEHVLSRVLEAGLGRRSERHLWRVARRGQPKPAPAKEAARPVELQHLEALHRTLQEEHAELKKQHEELVARTAADEIPEGRLPPAPPPPLPPPLELPLPVPEVATSDAPEAPGAPQAPEATAPAPEAPPEAPKPPEATAPEAPEPEPPRWGWWRSQAVRVMPEPELRQVVWYKDGVQMGVPVLQMHRPGSRSSRAPMEEQQEPREAFADWQHRKISELMTNPSEPPPAIPGCSHLSYSSAAAAAQDLRLAGGAGAPIVVVAVATQGPARNAGVLAGFQLLALNGRDFTKAPWLHSRGDELLPSLARNATSARLEVRMDFLDPAPRSHGMVSLADRWARRPLFQPTLRP
ncbi:unnamed protein product [Effrenium voratum]|nr:unnamed protein product [Effrenium voratum]